MKKPLLILHTLLLVLFCSQTLTAQTLSISSFSNNRVLSLIKYTSNETAYYYGDSYTAVAGQLGLYRTISRFNLSGISNNVVGATLSLKLNEKWNGLGLNIWDANPNIYPPINQWSDMAGELWTDLGSGALYGGSGSVHDYWNAFSLNDFALSNLVSAINMGNTFGIGIAPTSNTLSYAYIYEAKLNLQLGDAPPPMATPEPATIFLLGSSLLATAAYRRRYMKKKA